MWRDSGATVRGRRAAVKEVTIGNRSIARVVASPFASNSSGARVSDGDWKQSRWYGNEFVSSQARRDDWDDPK